MTDLQQLLDEVQARSDKIDSWHEYLPPEPHAHSDRKKLLAAVRVTLGLHQPERRWMPYEDADFSYDTAEEAAEDMMLSQIVDPSADRQPARPVPYFEVCAECKRVEEGADEYATRELGFLTSLWPCKTVREISEAMGAEHE